MKNKNASFIRRSQQIYKACALCEYAVATNVAANIDNLQPLTEQQEKEFSAVLKANYQTRLGLEKLISPAIAGDRVQRKKDVVNVVLEMQFLQKLEHERQESSNKESNINLDEELRQCSEELSQTSRLFARCMGKAVAKCS